MEVSFEKQQFLTKTLRKSENGFMEKAHEYSAGINSSRLSKTFLVESLQKFLEGSLHYFLDILLVYCLKKSRKKILENSKQMRSLSTPTIFQDNFLMILK